MDENALKKIVFDIFFNKDKTQKRFDEIRNNYKGNPKEDVFKLVEKYGMTEEDMFFVCCLAKIFENEKIQHTLLS